MGKSHASQYANFGSLPVKSYHAALTVLFLILSIISTAFAVCIPKKIHWISVSQFHAFILESE